jgi:hypothetical protein
MREPTEEELGMADIGSGETLKGDFNKSHMSLAVLHNRGWFIERQPMTGSMWWRNKNTRERQPLPFWLLELIAEERDAVQAKQRDAEKVVRQQMQAAARQLFGVAVELPSPSPPSPA